MKETFYDFCLTIKMNSQSRHFNNSFDTTYYNKFSSLRASKTTDKLVESFDNANRKNFVKKYKPRSQIFD